MLAHHRPRVRRRQVRQPAVHDQGVDDPLRAAAVAARARRAVIDLGQDYWVSWFQLDDLAHQWSQRLSRQGLIPGQRVALQEPAGVRFAAILHACLRCSAALVPISPSAHPEDLARILADARPRFLIRDAEVMELENPAAGDPEDATVLYTSGTSGPPKGVRHTLSNHLASARGCLDALGVDARDRWLLTLSPHHVGGLAIFIRNSLAMASCITLPEFEEGAVLGAIRDHGATLISLVPTMLERLLAAGGEDELRRLRVILIGGAPAPAERVREWIELGLKVAPSYGMTETASQIAIASPTEALEHPGSAGRVGSHARVEIEAGEIVVSGPSLFAGYVNPELNSEPDPTRFHTGDLGRLDGDVLSVLGRADDTIITGGENVRPEEVEAVLSSHPGVREAVVAGIDDPLWGQVVGAWVVGEVTPGELGAFCRERLPNFKIPKQWMVVNAIPRGSGGKVSRRTLGKTRTNFT